ncbi:HD domain-containing protein [Vibrio sp. EA2]|uniref:HD domain-containing protein n=1 Tax=Vibrio sp. EA2 TaxID=3079860 RepID=UPI0029490082|nr:HD domain-containing protein [Vibrio sp. EA2]MDV6254001.1 HD domain-containing protein [Vibrio sp. EA2]
MDFVNFTQMKDGTREEYLFLDELEAGFALELPVRIMSALRCLEHTLSGYRVSRLEHSLQAASRAYDDGADEEMIVAALIHDIGDELAPYNHSQYAASIIRPYVRPEVTWVINMHGVFQYYYYLHHLNGNPNQRDNYKDHPWYQSCVDFCEKYDQASFDPEYPTKELEFFEPMVQRIFTRKPFDLEHIGRDNILEDGVDIRTNT